MRGRVRNLEAAIPHLEFSTTDHRKLTTDNGPLTTDQGEMDTYLVAYDILHDPKGPAARLPRSVKILDCGDNIRCFFVD